MAAKNGELRTGSVAWHCAQLSVGEAHLVSDNGGVNEAANVQQTVRRLKENHKGDWAITTCYGITADDLQQRPFKFYRIERIK